MILMAQMKSLILSSIIYVKNKDGAVLLTETLMAETNVMGDSDDRPGNLVLELRIYDAAPQLYPFPLSLRSQKESSLSWMANTLQLK